jgi:transposase
LPDRESGVKVERKTMKTQIHKPSEGKARYTLEYKQEALDFWRKSGRSAAKVGAELGVRAPLLYRWAKQLRDAAQQGGVSEPKLAGRGVEHLEAENRRLREENAKLLEQREVLKKSLGILL